MQAISRLTCLKLNRDRFTEVLGKHHLEQIMAREKSAAVVTTRLMRLQVGACMHTCIRTCFADAWAHTPAPAELELVLLQHSGAPSRTVGLCQKPQLREALCKTGLERLEAGFRV